jgi:hypothetical protein
LIIFNKVAAAPDQGSQHSTPTSLIDAAFPANHRLLFLLVAAVLESGRD